MSMTLKSMSLSIIAEGFPQTLKIKCGKKKLCNGQGQRRVKSNYNSSYVCIQNILHMIFKLMT